MPDSYIMGLHGYIKQDEVRQGVVVSHKLMINLIMRSDSLCKQNENGISVSMKQLWSLNSLTKQFI